MVITLTQRGYLGMHSLDKLRTSEGVAWCFVCTDVVPVGDYRLVIRSD